MGGRPPHPPPPPPHPPQLGSERRGPPPPQGRGGAPTHRRNGDTVRATAAGPAPANPHRRAGATRTTEHERGRAPHDPPVTTAHSEGTEGGFAGQLGPPGERSTRGPSPPPHPGAALQPRPHARAGRERASDTERARKGYRRPPPGTRAGRPRRDTPPEAGGMPPPHPRGKPECDPPPRSSRRLTWGPRRTSGPTPAHRDAAQIVPREAGWARTGVVWGATPPMDSTTPVTPALLPAQGRQRDGKRQSDPPPYSQSAIRRCYCPPPTPVHVSRRSDGAAPHPAPSPPVPTPCTWTGASGHAQHASQRTAPPSGLDS